MKKKRLASGCRQDAGAPRVKGYINPFQPVFYARGVKGRTLEDALYSYAAQIEKAESLPAGAAKRYLKYCTAFVNGLSVKREDWAAFPVSSKDEIICNITPLGGGGEDKDPLRTVLIITVMAAAMIASSGVAGLGVFAEGATLAGLGGYAGGLAGAAVMAGGLLLVNAIAPIRVQNMAVDTAKDTAYQISGGQNKLKHWQSVECMLGRMRCAPAFAISPYTANDGRDQYWYAAYCWGYAEDADFPLLNSSLKIGETLLSSFEGSIEHVSYILRDGAALQFCDNIWEEAVNVELAPGGDWVERTTEGKVKKLNIDVLCPSGLFSGSGSYASVFFEIEYRKEGDDENVWQKWLSLEDVPGGTFKLISYLPSGNPGSEGVYEPASVQGWLYFDCGAGKLIVGWGWQPPTLLVPLYYIYGYERSTDGWNWHWEFNLSDQRPAEYKAAHYFDLLSRDDDTTITVAGGRYLGKPFLYDNFMASLAKTYEWEVPEGVYHIRLRRVTPETSYSTADTLYWYVIRSIKDSSPIRFNYPVVVTELKIKAQEQIAGMVNELTGVFAPKYHDPGYPDNELIASSNPATLLRYVLTGFPNERRVTAAEIDDESFRAFWRHCVLNDFSYDKYVEAAVDCLTLAREIAAAGRGFLVRQNGKYAVAFDAVRDYPVQHFTPANSWSFSTVRRFFNLPNAFRIAFFNAENDWQTDERIVYDDGYGDDTAEPKEGFPPYKIPQLYENMELAGITSPSQIWRLGREYIKAARLRPETHTLKVDMEYLVAGLRDLVRVSHDVLMVGWAYGRLKEIISAAEAITGARLEQGIEPADGVQYGISIRRSKDAGVIDARVTILGDMITFVPPLEEGMVEEGDLYSFGEYEKTTEDYIITEITPDEGLNATLKLAAYAPDVYSSPYDKIPDFTPNTSEVILPERKAPTPPENLNIVETLELRGNLPANVLYFNWSPPIASPVAVKSYQARYRLAGSAAWTDINTPNAGLELLNIPKGRYEFLVRAVSIYDIPSAWGELTVDALGDKQPPPDVRGLSSYYKDGLLYLTWDVVEDIRPITYSIRRGAVSWDVARWVVAKQAALELPIHANGVYQIKADTPSGAESANAATISIDNIERLQKNVIAKYDEAPLWRGRKSGFKKDRGTLRFGGKYHQNNIYGEPGVYAQQKFYRNISSTRAVYYAENALSLAVAAECSVSIDYSVVVTRMDDVYAITPDIYTAPYIYEIIHSDYYFVVEVRVLDSAGLWSPWRAFSDGRYLGAAFQLRFRIEFAEADKYMLVVENFSYSIDVPDRVETLYGAFADNEDGLTWVFNPPFNAPPSVVGSIVAEAGAEADRHKKLLIADNKTLVTKEGALIYITDDSGEYTDGVVNLIAQGY
jgi:hypothetical protein